MQKLLRSFFITVLLGFFTVASAQLPPEMERQLRPKKERGLTLPYKPYFKEVVERRLEKENYKAALKMVERAMVLQKVPGLTFSPEFYFKDTIKKLLMEKRYITLFNIMEKIIELQKEHSLTLSHEFHFQYAQVAFSVGLFQTAINAASKYLSAVQEGEFYEEVLALLNKAEQAEQIIPIEPEMIGIPAGHFLRRSVYSTNSVYSVNIDSFALSKYEVTFEEYDLFTDATGREQADDRGWGRGRHPVINVSWEDAVAYTHWLSSQTGKNYRLPSEAEWEYAARAGSTVEHTGSTTKHSWLRGIGGNGANCFQFSIQWDGLTTPVGSFSANKWGLHDMICNVSEWMEHDWYYKRPSACGGSWSQDPLSVFWTPCWPHPSWYWASDVGFRVAQDL